jgi:uncharacterized protein (TIGR03032 family)
MGDHLTAGLERPVFLISPPGSGASLVLGALARSPDVLTIPDHRPCPLDALLEPASRGWHSDRLGPADLRSDTAALLAAALLADAAPVGRSGRLVHESPKNALRVPFLAAAFPDARFVFVYGDPAVAVGSIIEGWRSGRFVTHPDLPEWQGPPWSFALIPGWRDLPPADLGAVAAAQWQRSVEQALDDLQARPADQWCVVSSDQLLADLDAEVRRLCEFCQLTEPANLVGGADYAPRLDRDEVVPVGSLELDDVLPALATTDARAREVFAHAPRTSPRGDQPVPAEEGEPFSSVSTSNLAPLLRSLALTPLVTTYQSGRLIAVRSDGTTVNTHFRMFASPMGVAVRPGALALGTKRSVWEFRNMPAVAAKIPPPGSHDACFIPSRSHVTGDIAVHEMAYVGGELWIVNTRFSCLATIDSDHSFRPRWRPPFVSALAAEDRCHLNGMAVVDDSVAYVTALGTTDVAGGWREHKAHGGVIIDVATGEIVCDGLSMPHSPRWHDGRLWVLESGEGRLCTVDPSTGGREIVAEVPGFARGLAFAGPLAFVGLSQVRESIFGGIPIADRLDESERKCGMWVVDTRNGATVAFLRFEGVVQEVFDVQLLHGIRFPDLVEPDTHLTDSSFVLPDEALSQAQR